MKAGHRTLFSRGEGSAAGTGLENGRSTRLLKWHRSPGIDLSPTLTARPAWTAAIANCDQLSPFLCVVSRWKFRCGIFQCQTCASVEMAVAAAIFIFQPV